MVEKEKEKKEKKEEEERRRGGGGVVIEISAAAFFPLSLSICLQRPLTDQPDTSQKRHHGNRLQARNHRPSPAVPPAPCSSK